jgi:homoserine dehydrogenase
MSGTPALHLGRELLAAATISRIQGILNGTTNYILTRMEEGASYEAALAEAQERGYAEADPTGDVEGFDAAAKVVILARLLMDLPLTMADVERRGITGLTPELIAEARAANQHWRLIGSIEKSRAGYKASVFPICLSSDHPLAMIRGVTNAITYSTELLGDITLIGPGAGRLQTGYAVVSDLLHIHQRCVARRQSTATALDRENPTKTNLR